MRTLFSGAQQKGVSCRYATRRNRSKKSHRFRPLYRNGEMGGGEREGADIDGYVCVGVSWREGHPGTCERWREVGTIARILHDQFKKFVEKGDPGKT